MNHPPPPDGPSPLHGGPAPPSRDGVRGRRIALLTAGLVTAAALGGSLAYVLGDEETDDPGAAGAGATGDDTRYRLEWPGTLRAYDVDSTVNTGFMDENTLAEVGVRIHADTSARYSDTDASQWRLKETRRIHVQGGYGEVPDPEQAVDLVMDRFTEGFVAVALRTHDTELVGSPETHAVDGLTVRCQRAEVTVPDGPYPHEVPYCAWADDHTVGSTFFVAYAPRPHHSAEATPLPLTEAAELTVELHQNSVVER